MYAEDLKHTQRPVRDSTPITPPETDQRASSPLHREGWSLPRTLEDDVEESMQAMGQICRVAIIGTLVCGLGGVAILLSLLVF